MAMTYDDEAVSMAAAKLNLSELDVQKSVRVFYEYERIHKSLKSKRAEEKRKAVYAEWLKNEKEANPLDCYCEQEGHKVKRKWKDDGIVGYYMMRSCSPYDTSGKLYEYEYYKCSRCGKRYIRPCPAYA